MRAKLLTQLWLYLLKSTLQTAKWHDLQGEF